MAADILDPYNDHPDVVAIPVAEAIELFREHWSTVHRDHVQRNTLALRAGTSTTLTRKAATDEWRRLSRIVELRLFRSIMAV